MERVVEFLKEAQTYYLATVEGNQPRVRPFGTAHIFEGKLYCQTAHCGRCKPHFDFGDNTFPIVPYRHLPQTLIGMTADCRSLV